MKSRLLFLIFYLITCVSYAQNVALTGSMGNKALLVINNKAPRAISEGEVIDGVKLISLKDGKAVLEIGGRRETILMGASPISLYSVTQEEKNGREIILNANEQGHFVSQGSINGHTVNFIIDTGATVVALGRNDAERLGIQQKAKVPMLMNTANGQVRAYAVMLDSIRIQGVELYNIQAVIMPETMPIVLLGNSFLNRFQMKRDNNMLTLSKRF